MQDKVWQQLRDDAEQAARDEPVMAGFLRAQILEHETLERALAGLLAKKLDCADSALVPVARLFPEIIEADASLRAGLRTDLSAVLQRDSACTELLTPLLYFKGFHALQTHRLAHCLWRDGQRHFALFLQNRCAEAFSVDIHPAARIGSGLMLDHADGVVIGETAVVADNVSIMQSVTLGGTGKDEGDRHPKIDSDVLISAGAKVLGNIKVGIGAKIGAGSVVLRDVPPHTTVAGIPAKVIGRPDASRPALAMDHDL